MILLVDGGVMIRMRVCTGWSGLLLPAYQKNNFLQLRNIYVAIYYASRAMYIYIVYVVIYFPSRVTFM